MASYLIEGISANDKKKVLEFLSRERRLRPVHILEYRDLIEADLSEAEVGQIGGFAALYADAPLAAFSDSASSFWKTAVFTDVLDQIAAPKAWEHSVGEGVTLAVVDSGINGAAREFPRWKRAGPEICFSFTDGGWHDNKGHGTMAAFVAAGTGLLTKRFDGVAPMAKLVPCRHNFTQNDAIKVLDRLRSMILKNEVKKPLVVNCSYGWECCHPPSLSLAHPLVGIVQDLVSIGVVVVCAAGNNHDPAVCPSCDPAEDVPNTIWGTNSLDDVICVGAVNWQGLNTGGEHSKSSRGPGQFAKKGEKPDCVAPSYGEVLWGDHYLRGEWWGTSGAAPLVSGLAALALARTRGGLQPHEIKQVILEGCRSVPGAKVRVGCGLINCLETLKCL
jgi:serine protease AprX